MNIKIIIKYNNFGPYIAAIRYWVTVWWCVSVYCCDIVYIIGGCNVCYWWGVSACCVPDMFKTKENLKVMNENWGDSAIPEAFGLPGVDERSCTLLKQGGLPGNWRETAWERGYLSYLRIIWGVLDTRVPPDSNPSLPDFPAKAP